MSKRMFQENKARQIFRKLNISYPVLLTNVGQNFYLTQIVCVRLVIIQKIYNIRDVVL